MQFYTNTTGIINFMQYAYIISGINSPTGGTVPIMCPVAEGTGWRILGKPAGGSTGNRLEGLQRGIWGNRAGRSLQPPL